MTQEMTIDQIKLFLKNEQLVPWTMWRNFGSRIPQDEWEDYMSEGRIGLARACKLFNPQAGYTFSTYAIKCITSEINRALLKRGTKKRQPPPLTFSLDAPIKSKTDDPLSHASVIADHYNLAEHVEIREQLRLAMEDPVIRFMVENACSMGEASRKLKVSYLSVRNQKGKIKRAVKQFSHPPKFNRKEVKND